MVSPHHQLVHLLARHQEGVASLDQARRLGFTRGAIEHRLVSGRWERLLPGVVVLPGVPMTPLATLVAWSLVVSPEAAVSHATGAVLLGLDGVVGPDDPEFTVRRGVDDRARDARRRNELTRLGVAVLEFTYRQVISDPVGVMADVADVLARTHSASGSAGAGR